MYKKFNFLIVKKDELVKFFGTDRFKEKSKLLEINVRIREKLSKERINRNKDIRKITACD